MITPRQHRLIDGRMLLIREAAPEDARIVLDYVQRVCGETDFFTFGPGEFTMTEAEEAAFLRDQRDADNRVYLTGWIDGEIVATMNFSGGNRPRLRHSGEFGMSVLQRDWGRGIGSLMLDALIDWATQTGVITKINLKVRFDNERAMRLYRSKGFILEGTIRREIRIGDTYYDHHCMGLVL